MSEIDYDKAKATTFHILWENFVIGECNIRTNDGPYNTNDTQVQSPCLSYSNPFLCMPQSNFDKWQNYLALPLCILCLLGFIQRKFLLEGIFIVIS